MSHALHSLDVPCMILSKISTIKTILLKHRWVQESSPTSLVINYKEPVNGKFPNVTSTVLANLHTSSESETKNEEVQ